MLVIRDPNRPLYLDPERQLEILKKQFGLVAQDRDLSGEAFRVLLYLYGFLTLGTSSPLNKEEIGRAIGMKGQNVGRAIRLLAKKGVLRIEPAAFTKNGIALNPSYPVASKPNQG